ncbi:MAG: TraB/GumN family protein [Pseudomonadota bacterium]
MRTLVVLILAVWAGFWAVAAAEPPRWIVSDADSEIILFPTIHILPDDLVWRTPSLNAAISAADEVWFEVPLADSQDPATMGPLIAELGMSRGLQLRQRLDPETYAALEEVLNALGLPLASFEPMRPWFAAINISILSLTEAGFNPDAGVERALQREVDGKTLRHFETTEQQLRFFADLPDAVEVAFLQSTLEDPENSTRDLLQLAEDWAKGDLSGLEALLIADIRDVSEELYQVLIVQRNQAWAEILDQELQGSGKAFVAVGAGHLVGEEGLPALLAARGYDVQGPDTD